MKFGKCLSNQIEQALPEWRNKFLSYKELKKLLKLINSKPNGVDSDKRPLKRPRIEDYDGMSKEEIDFIQLLEDEIEKINNFFEEKEEIYIIRLKELQLREARSNKFDEEMIKIKKEIVDFHGEMVLLENYSALNYTGIAKILKKYDKRTGAVMRLPFIQKVVQQPFFTTDLLYQLVKECESMIERLFPKAQIPSEATSRSSEGSDPSTSATSTSENDGSLPQVNEEIAEIAYMESLYLKSVISALQGMKDIRSKSSTVSVFSLPPVQITGVEETWKKIPILEQVAK